MQLFIDTAKIEEIRKAYSWGIIDGVTTNPTHIANSGGDFEAVVREIFELVDGPISVETISQTADEIIAEARIVAGLHANAVAKIAISVEGLKAVKVVSAEGIKTNVTLCFSALQAHLAAKCGATYISPFIHRKDIIGDDGMELIRQIRAIYDNYGYETKILAASIRTPRQVLECLLAGADVATMPIDILEQLYHHPMTDMGLQMFLNDWQRVPPTKLFDKKK